MSRMKFQLGDTVEIDPSTLRRARSLPVGPGRVVAVSRDGRDIRVLWPGEERPSRHRSGLLCHACVELGVQACNPGC